MILTNVQGDTNERILRQDAFCGGCTANEKAKIAYAGGGHRHGEPSPD